MERADEPPPPILLYQIGVGCVRGAKGGGVGVGGWGKKSSKMRRVEERQGEVLGIMLMIV